MHSSVKAAVCGLRKTLSFLSKGLFDSGGSISKTSKPAPKIKSYIINLQFLIFLIFHQKNQ